MPEKDSSLQLEKLVRQIPGALYRYYLKPNGEYGFDYLSPQGAELFDIDHARTLAEADYFTSRMWPAERAEVLRMLQISAKALSPFHCIFRFPVRGETRWFACQSLPSPAEDGSIYWTGQLYDVTAQKEAEDALQRSQTLLQAAQEQAGLGCWDFDVQSGRISWSPEVFAIHGVDPRCGEPDFPSLGRLFHPEDFPILAAAVDRAITHGESYRFTLRIIRSDTREIRYVSATGGVLRNPLTQDIERLFGTILDINDHKRLEESLAAARDAAEQSTLAKSNFLATMSHELRTPLNGIVGMCALLRQTNLDAQQLECSEAIHLSAEALLALVNDILDWSRIEAGKLQMESTVFSLEECLRHALEIIRPQSQAKGLELSLAGLQIQPAPDQQTYLLGDPNRLRQIFLNLASNAIKFTAEGAIRIQFEELAAADPTGQSLAFRISIHDTGIGISPEQMERLFLRFSQADESTTRRFGGSGLGLAISKSLVELMGGRIGAQSKVDCGSSFWFSVELPRAQAPAAVVPTVSAPARLVSLPPANTRRILVAEDNLVNQKLADRILRQAGFQLDIAPTGLIALQMALTRDYDLILMDCHMPDLDGYETTRRLRTQLPRHLPIIGLTASAMNRDREDCLESGMDDYLAKPYRPQQLLAVLERWL